MKTFANLFAASLLATSVFMGAAPPAQAVNSVSARPSADTPDELEYKAYAAQLVSIEARKEADDARKYSNNVVATSTTTKQQRTQANLSALHADNYATWAEAAYDQAEVNAATVSVNNAETAELRARRDANSASAVATRARTAATKARAAATAQAIQAPNQTATKRALFNAGELEVAAYHLELNKAVTAQYQSLTQEYFTKAKARVIAGRAITAHRGIKGHLSLPLSMPLSKPILRGPAEVGPLIVGPGEVGPLIVGTPIPATP